MHEARYKATMEFAHLHAAQGTRLSYAVVLAALCASYQAHATSCVPTPRTAQAAAQRLALADHVVVARIEAVDRTAWIATARVIESFKGAAEGEAFAFKLERSPPSQPGVPSIASGSVDAEVGQVYFLQVFRGEVGTCTITAPFPPELDVYRAGAAAAARR